MTCKGVATFVVLALVAGCGTTGRTARVDARRQIARAGSVHRRALRPQPPAPLQALVTAQDEDRLLVVGLPSGRLIHTVPIPGGPSYVDATRGVVVVVSTGSGTVTLLDRRSLRTIRVFQGFVSPHIPAISPDGRYAYVTDDGSGELSVIGLYDHRLISRVFVGFGAHHLAFTPSEREVWVALTQTARTIALLSTVNAAGMVDPGHPHVVGSLHPRFLAHDLLFTPGGRQVWITSADGSSVGVFDARTRRLLRQVPAGVGPQHIVFAGGFAYITSGYGSSIEQVDLYSGRVLRRVYAPDGSFDLDAARHYVVTASLLRGTLAIYNGELQLLHVRQLASSTEDVTLSAP
jgi:DNA-binding beta-propeller fold protein YncE